MTITPVNRASSTEPGLIASELSGSWRKAEKIVARPSPSTMPTAAPVMPTTAASSSTATRTWRPLAPTARRRAISRVRWATMMANEL